MYYSVEDDIEFQNEAVEALDEQRDLDDEQIRELSPTVRERLILRALDDYDSDPERLIWLSRLQAARKPAPPVPPFRPGDPF